MITKYINGRWYCTSLLDFMVLTCDRNSSTLTLKYSSAIPVSLVRSKHFVQSLSKQLCLVTDVLAVLWCVGCMDVWSHRALKGLVRPGLNFSLAVF